MSFKQKEDTGNAWQGLLRKYCYFNSDDPRIFVQGEGKSGITLNLAHPTSIMIIIGVIVGYIVGGMCFESKFGLGFALVFTLVYSFILGCLFFVFMKVDNLVHSGFEDTGQPHSSTKVVKQEKEEDYG